MAEGDFPKTDGDIYYALDVNKRLNLMCKLHSISYMNELKNDSLEWNPDDFDIDIFTADTAATQTNMLYDAGNDRYYVDDDYFMDIHATSTTDSSAGDIVVTNLGGGVWRVSCSVGDDYELKRAKVIGHLFYNVGGGASANIKNYVTVTAVKPSDSNDVGYRFIQAMLSDASPDAGGEYINATGTFAAGTNAPYCGWAALHTVNAAGAYDGNGYYHCPAGTTLMVIGQNTTTSEVSTDTSADETDTPANVYLYTGSSGGATGYSHLLLMTKVAIDSWATGGTGDPSLSEYDFYSDGSIPITTQYTDGGISDAILITDVFTVTALDTSAFVHSEHTMDGGATVQLAVSFDNGANYTNVDNDTWVTIPNAGTQAKVKWTITRTLTGNSYISGYVMFNDNGT